MPSIAHSASGNKASGAEDCRNPVPNSSDGESIGKLPPSTTAAGNFITESRCVNAILIMFQFNSCRYGIIAYVTYVEISKFLVVAA